MAEIKDAFNDIESQIPLQKEGINGLAYLDNLMALKIGAGNQIFHAGAEGIWLGAKTFAGAPFAVDMEGNGYASSFDLTAAGYSKINIFRQDGIPTSIAVGDLWFDSNDGNKMYRAGAVGATTIALGQWELVSTQGITTFLQDSIPTSLAIGDLWIDTNDGNKQYRAASAGADAVTAGEWELVSTPGVNIFAQDAVPTSTAIGDLWYDTNDGNKQYRAASVGADTVTAGEWELVSTSGIQVFAQDAIPTSISAGDLWYDTNDNNKVYTAYAAGVSTISSTGWILLNDLRAADALLKASTSQTLTGNFAIGNGNVLIDGVNARILINDGTNDRVLLGLY